MTLARTTEHPGQRSYVLKLHRDADPARGVLRGRVENLATGRHFEFDDAAQLLAGLAGDLAGGDGAPRPSPQ
jgi:hypothetical protein